MFSSKLKNFGVLKIDRNIVKMFESQSQYSNLNVGQEVIDARWTGNCVVVQLKDGKSRRYSTLSQYINI
jgi:hypothetical protein